MREYSLLRRTRRAGTRGPLDLTTFTAAASPDLDPFEIVIERARLTEQEVVDVASDPSVAALTPTMPTRLVSPLAANETSFTDRDLPLWRVRFFYCVATVIEGTIGDLPTLIESKRSQVMKVETTENFELEVEGGGADKASVVLVAWLDGGERRESLEVAPGQRIAKSIRRDGRPFDLDTGLTLQELRVVDGTAEKSVQRAEFLPDGRRKIDPATGRPSFHAETVTMPTRTLELRMTEPGGATRTLSAPVSPPAGG